MLERKLEYVKEEYEKEWEDTLENIQSLISGGERNLQKILNLMEQTENRFDKLPGMRDEIASQLNVPRDDRNIALFKLVAAAGKYALVPRNYVDKTAVATITSLISKDTDFVVELGSGWGRNLLEIYLHTSFTHLQYIACEPIESGRRATKILGDLKQGMQIRTNFFDFHDPDMSFLEGNPNALFFTCHAIEQCTHFNSRLFDLMMEKTAKCNCVHIEPIGWQRYAQAQTVRTMIEEGKTSHVVLTFDDREFLQNSAIWAAVHKYNTDLLGVIDRYRESGRIYVDVLSYDFLGENPFNPSTLVVWHKIAS